MNELRFSRFFWAGVAITILPIVIVFRLVFLQFENPETNYLKGSLDISRNTYRRVVPLRGVIVDRHGREMATNQRAYEVSIAPDQVTDPNSVAMVLNVVFGSAISEYETKIVAAQKEELRYILVDDYVPEEQATELKDWISRAEASKSYTEATRFNGIHVVEHLKRNYPNKTLAANIIGFVGWVKEKTDQLGFYGVEGYYNDLLTGKIQERLISRHPNEAKDYNVEPEGASLVLTIDREIQAMTEDVLDQALDQNGAESGTILILDPTTGEILAMATTPRLDPNRYWDSPKEFLSGTPFNRAISQPYEPGSVYKPLTVAAALDSGKVTPDFSYVDQGVLMYAGVPIYNWNRGSWGPQNLLGCLQHSLNVCMATLSTQYMGNEVFYRYMRAFGIGQPTGIDLDGEVSGYLKTPKRSDQEKGSWHESDLATNSFGQGVSTTPLQMAMAISALANDGKMMVPHVVKSIAQQGYQINIENQIAGAPVRPETARMVTELLANALEIEASNALVPGYRVAGKTGTGQIASVDGYLDNETSASFVGYGPVDDPQFLVYIWFDRPKSSIWGSEVAAPVFSELVQKLVVLMNIPPDVVRKGLANR
jgi:cell division protein FtsI/penicillin-binding protein 2